MPRRYLSCLLLVLCLPLTVLADDPGRALRDAAGSGDVEAVRALLGQGVDPDAANAYGATALSFAADKGHFEVIRLLVEKGADVNVADTFYGFTPIQWAAFKGDADLIIYLLEHGAEDVEAAMNGAIYGDLPEVVSTILATRELSADELWRALATARRREKKQIATLLEKAGAKPPPASDFKIDPAVLASYAGVYVWAEQGIERALTFEDGTLMGSFYGRPPCRMEAVDATTFRPTDGMQYTIRFQVEGDRVTGFTFLAEGRDPIPFVRKAAAEEPAETAEAEAAETDQSAEIAKAPEAPKPVPAGAATRDWPAFRGPNAAGTAGGYPLPVTWDVETNENVRWKIAIPGRGHSSPIVWGDRLFLTTAVNAEGDKPYPEGVGGDVSVVNNKAKHSWRVFAFDKRSGEKLWERVAFEGVPRADNHIIATQANSTPATDGKHLVAILGSEGLVGYDLDGNLKWKQDLGLLDGAWFYDPSYQWGHGSSPIIWKDLVIVQVDRSRDSYVAAFHLADGRPAWRTSRDNLPSWGTPTLVAAGDRVELVTNGTHKIRAYDPRNGSELWQLGPMPEITVGTPVVGHGLVFLTASYRPVQPIYAIRPGGRGDISLPEGVESSDHVVWKVDRGGTYIPTPLVYGEYLYTIDSILTCYLATTGERLYRERIGGRAGTFGASPVAGDGKLYIGNEAGDVYVVKAGPEYELLATNAMGEVLIATPAISDGRIFIRTLEHLYAVGEATPAQAGAGVGR